MNSIPKAWLVASLLAVSLVQISCTESQARRMFARGANGSMGAYASQNAYGGRMGARAFGPNAGGGFNAANYAGPNGGSIQSARGFAYKNGVGAARGSAWQGTAPNGATGSGYSKNMYNAQTGQGERSSSEQFTNASGQNYGYNGNTSYTKGQGATSTINTDNNGTYDVNWQKGSKPNVPTE